MLKIILVIVALALYGANNLMSSFTSGSNDSSTASTKKANESLATSSPLLAAAANMAGLAVDDLPETGCSESVISADNLNELLSYLPENQQQALGALLNDNSTMWSTQFYSGTKGTGLCIPAKGTLVVLPAVENEHSSQLQLLLNSFVQQKAE